ncbi:MAG: hypothetical protein EZS28_005851 [Streblomastix strix]|uniref:Uncharacterized protein n=1 Tax=Streblomastix strix TaxID=222440 RepID=A0A5J4WWJ3_9EUKA|nr:MAG: hypothetical protein EZS28_005851 [Streblomastix strix]
MIKQRLITQEIRWQCVLQLLDSTQPISISKPSRSELNEEDLLTVQAKLLLFIFRKLSVVGGRTCLAFASRNTGYQYHLGTNSLNTCGILMPGKVPIELTKVRLKGAVLVWPHFFIGASAAISHTQHMDSNISRTWLLSTLRSQSLLPSIKAGFFFGLGLCRQFSPLLRADILALSFESNTKLLSSLLVGVALSLSVEVKNELDQIENKRQFKNTDNIINQIDPFSLIKLNDSPTINAGIDFAMTQIASLTNREQCQGYKSNFHPDVTPSAFIGLGLLCCRSGRRDLIEKLIQEEIRMVHVSRRHPQATSVSISAGVSLGLILLGMGEDDEMKIGLCDLDITNKLISLIAFRGQDYEDAEDVQQLEDEYELEWIKMLQQNVRMNDDPLNSISGNEISQQILPPWLKSNDPVSYSSSHMPSFDIQRTEQNYEKYDINSALSNIDSILGLTNTIKQAQRIQESISQLAGKPQRIVLDPNEFADIMDSSLLEGALVGITDPLIDSWTNNSIGSTSSLDGEQIRSNPFSVTSSLMSSSYQPSLTSSAQSSISQLLSAAPESIWSEKLTPGPLQNMNPFASLHMITHGISHIPYTHHTNIDTNPNFAGNGRNWGRNGTGGRNEIKMFGDDTGNVLIQEHRRIIRTTLDYALQLKPPPKQNQLNLTPDLKQSSSTQLAPEQNERDQTNPIISQSNPTSIHQQEQETTRKNSTSLASSNQQRQLQDPLLQSFLGIRSNNNQQHTNTTDQQQPNNNQSRDSNNTNGWEGEDGEVLAENEGIVPTSAQHPSLMSGAELYGPGIKCMQWIAGGSKCRGPSCNSNAVSLGAITALTLIYLGTGAQEVIQALNLPENLSNFAALSPEAVYLRAMGTALIDWDNIIPSKAWLRSCIPEVVQDTLRIACERQRLINENEQDQGDRKEKKLSPLLTSCAEFDMESILLNTLVGLTGRGNALALKFAGSNDNNVIDCLLWLSHIMSVEIINAFDLIEEINQTEQIKVGTMVKDQNNDQKDNNVVNEDEIFDTVIKEEDEDKIDLILKQADGLILKGRKLEQKSTKQVIDDVMNDVQLLLADLDDGIYDSSNKENYYQILHQTQFESQNTNTINSPPTNNHKSSFQSFHNKYDIIKDNHFEQNNRHCYFHVTPHVSSSLTTHVYLGLSVVAAGTGNAKVLKPLLLFAGKDLYASSETISRTAVLIKEQPPQNDFAMPPPRPTVDSDMPSIAHFSQMQLIHLALGLLFIAGGEKTFTVYKKNTDSPYIYAHINNCLSYIRIFGLWLTLLPSFDTGFETSRLFPPNFRLFFSLALVEKAHV